MSRYRLGSKLLVESDQGLTVTEAVQEYLSYQRRKAASPSYLAELHSMLIGSAGRPWTPFLPWAVANGITHPSRIEKRHVESYLDKTRARITRQGYGKVCAILIRFFRWLVDEGHISAVPTQISRPQRLRPEIKVFVEAEMLRLRNVVVREHPRDWAIFMLLLDTGIRTGELCGLRVADVHWDREEIVIRAERSKTRRERVIPLAGSLAALRRYAAIRGSSTERTEAFFLAFYSTPTIARHKGAAFRKAARSWSFAASPLTRGGLYQLVAKWGRLAGILEARCSPHTFRHFFATEYLRNGGNVLVTLPR